MTILCEYRNRRRWQPRACFDRAVRFLQDIGERTGHTMAICVQAHKFEEGEPAGSRRRLEGGWVLKSTGFRVLLPPPTLILNRFSVSC